MSLVRAELHSVPIPKSDGIEIDKETGKVAVIQLPDNVEAFCLILERLIRER
jgi:hypothetical protein